MTNHTSVSAMACCLQCKKEYEVLSPDLHICGQMEMNLTVSVDKTLKHIEEEESKMHAESKLTPVGKKKRIQEIGKEDVAYLEWLMVQIRKNRSIFRWPLMSDFIGENVVTLVVHEKKQKFIVVKEDKTESVIRFTSSEGKKVIDLLMVVIPGHFSKFKDSALYKALLDMNLSGYLTAKAKVSDRKKRDTFVMPAMVVEDIWVFENKMVVGQLMHDISLSDLEEKYFEEREIDGITQFVPKESVDLVIAKDTDLSRVETINSLFRKQSGSSDYKKFAVALKKPVQDVAVAKKYKNGGVVWEVLEKVRAVVLDELCFLDASGKAFPFEHRNGAVLRAIFSKFSVVHSVDGKLVKGADMSGVPFFKTYSATTKSPSQDRNSSANAFDSVKSACIFFYGTGQLEMTYADAVKVDDEKTGYFVEDVKKSSKRYNVGGANGVMPEHGLLSKFMRGHKVEYIPSGKGFVHGEIKPAYYILTASDGEKITIATIDDFYTILDEKQAFLVNVLNKEMALQGAKPFAHWNHKDARKILKRNCTDGGGMHNLRMDQALREAGCINSFDAHQSRPMVATKGASRVDEPVCQFLGADIVLTDGMVKSKRFLEDLRKNGLQYFVVGQRKDGEDGVQLASQGSQNFHLSVEEMKRGVDRTVESAKQAVESLSPSALLSWINASGEETESDLKVASLLRLARERKEILDEQWVMNEVKSLVVRELNKLLNAKMFVERARNRYMFTDPIAIYNAILAGRYEIRPEDGVLKPFEVVCPSKDEDGNFFMEEGEAVAVRFPVGAPHEIPVVTAVAPPEYQEYIEAGLWQGCVFFDAFTWIVAMMSGADHDGDSAEVLFGKDLVAAVKRMKEKMFGGHAVLPLIDAYVALDDTGNVLSMGTGCPTYKPADTKEAPEEEWKQVGPFYVRGYQIMFDPKDFQGQYGEVNRRKYLELRTEMAQKIAISNIEKSLIGVIANRIMILNDLLTRNVLTKQERFLVEIDIVNLCIAGKWEIDRPKHGGLYAEMPLMKRLFSHFTAIHFNEEQLEWDDKTKYEFLAEEKQHYRHIFGPIKDWSDKKNPVIIGFKVMKPQWLASQKDERGEYYEDSAYQQVFGSIRDSKTPRSYAQMKIEHLCEEFKKGHNNSTANNIRELVMQHMEVSVETRNIMKAQVAVLYQAYAELERQRRSVYENWREQHIKALQEKGAFRGKNLFSMTKAKIDAKLRKEWPLEMEGFSDGREVLKGLLRKGLYQLASKVEQDPRALAGALYLHIGEQKTKGNAVWRADGREYRFAASNGNIHIPFEVFAEEMFSLISGPISKTPFMTMDVTFTLVKGTLIPSTDGVRVRVTQPVEKLAGKTVHLYRALRVAVRKETQTDGQVRLVMNFLRKDATVTELALVTVEDTAFRGIPRKTYAEGIYDINVERIEYDQTGETAVIYFE